MLRFGKSGIITVTLTALYVLTVFSIFAVSLFYMMNADWSASLDLGFYTSSSGSVFDFPSYR
ncbi:MAG: hypothetical protein AAB886_00190 [Patescibacteria group bacterium]